MDNKELTKDQEFIVRKQISEWAKKNKIKHFEEKFEIVQSFNTDLYKIKIKERFCRREFSDEIKAYDSETIKPSSLKDIWKYSTNGTNSSNSDLLEFYLSEDFFNQLKKNPKMLKENNMKDLSEKLDDYEGYKKALFEKNQSTYPLPSSYNLIVCPNCVGKGTTICYNCNGSGKTSCYRCDGTKWIVEYNAPRRRCYSCNGTGYKVCNSCDGAKKLICSTCEGKGKALEYIALKELFTVNENFYTYNEFISENLKNILSEKANFLDLEEIELKQSNKDSIIKSNKLLNEIPKLKEIVDWQWDETSKNLEENERIDNYEIKFSKINVMYVKYKYANQEYELALFGDDYQIACDETPNSKKRKIKQNNNSCGDISDRSRTTTLLLCFFFGYFGAHRFYAKRYSSAIVELLSSFILIGFIWSSIDLLIIICGRFKDNENKYIKNW